MERCSPIQEENIEGEDVLKRNREGEGWFWGKKKRSLFSIPTAFAIFTSIILMLVSNWILESIYTPR